MEFHYANLLPLSSDPLIINVIKFALALLLIGPQTILLGATFPLMTSAVLRTLPAAAGDNIALLYFSNSIGAAAGVLASAFVLISWSGLPGAMFTAALINIGVALFAWLLVRSTPATQAFEWLELLMKGIARTDQGYTIYLMASHLLCFVVMLPTTFMAGMTLPLLTNGLLREGYGERSIGAVYAWNTLGSIGGVLLAIHFLIPELGLKAALIVGAGVDMLTGIVLLCVAAGTMFGPIMATAAAWVPA